jgi:hypothetical protein
MQCENMDGWPRWYCRAGDELVGGIVVGRKRKRGKSHLLLFGGQAQMQEIR